MEGRWNEASFASRDEAEGGNGTSRVSSIQLYTFGVTFSKTYV